MNDMIVMRTHAAVIAIATAAAGPSIGRVYRLRRPSHNLRNSCQAPFHFLFRAGVSLSGFDLFLLSICLAFMSYGCTLYSTVPEHWTVSIFGPVVFRPGWGSSGDFLQILSALRLLASFCFVIALFSRSAIMIPLYIKFCCAAFKICANGTDTLTGIYEASTVLVDFWKVNTNFLRGYHD